jgi:hypothetical protein
MIAFAILNMPVKILPEKMDRPWPVIDSPARYLTVEYFSYRFYPIIIKKLPDRILIAIAEYRLHDGIGAERRHFVLRDPPEKMLYHRGQVFYFSVFHKLSFL